MTANFSAQLKVVRLRPVTLPKETTLDADDLEMQALGAGESVIGAEEDTTCICGRSNRIDKFMLDCDRCHKWFHGSCVQIRKDDIPEFWVCDDCKMLCCVKEQAKFFQYKKTPEKKSKGKINGKKGGKKKGVVGDGDEKVTLESEEALSAIVFRQLLLNYLLQKSQSDSNLDEERNDTARRFQIAKWVQQLEEEKVVLGDVPRDDDAVLESTRLQVNKSKQRQIDNLLQQWESRDDDPSALVGGGGGNGSDNIVNLTHYSSVKGLVLSIFSTSTTCVRTKLPC